MIQDALATFASAQTGTLSTAHTDIIDFTTDNGNDYRGSWFVFQVSTSFTQTGTTTRLNVQLQTSDTSTFTDSDDVTLVTSMTFTGAQLTAGKFWAVQVPPGAKRYLRAYNVVSTFAGAAFTGGAWNSFITPSVDVRLDRRYNLGY